MNKQKFDLTEKRPQVLLFGNGLVYNKKWDEVIDDLKDENEKNFLKGTDVPYPLQSSVLFYKNDSKRYEMYKKYFKFDIDNKTKYEYKTDYPILKNIANTDFDAYLTTNYTYEMENIFHTNYLWLKNKDRYATTTLQRKNQKRITHTYNTFQYNGKQKNIWHIHGEVRNKSSLIFTHDDYCKLIGDLKSINDSDGNKYEKEKSNFSIKSWMDYFIVADIYILGFGFSFAEIDLWWLLCRRLREKSGYGKIYFFEPKCKSQADKYKVMKKFDVKIEHLSFDDEKDKLSNEEYINFYTQALKKIKKLVGENQK